MAKKHRKTTTRKARRGGFLKTSYKHNMATKKFTNEMAIIGYAFLGEPLIDKAFTQFAPQLGVSDDIVKLGAGYFLKNKKGMIGDLARAMYVIQLYKIGKNATSGDLAGLLGGKQ